MGKDIPALRWSHAEVNAIEKVQDKSLLKTATLYVTLEPCDHHGNTPPCSIRIIRMGIPEVIVGTTDPNPKVAGNGIARLTKNGVAVTTGILETECKHHHRMFLTTQVFRRPYIVLKWAESQDGYIAPDPKLRTGDLPRPYWITNPYSRQLVHKWRGECQAILVGTNTGLADNPKLDTRLWQGHHRCASFGMQS